MSELMLAGDGPRSQNGSAQRKIRGWCSRLTRGAESVLAAAPFGESLSEEEFAFCLLLIAAHL
jgi:hypothetical protein